FVETGCFGGAPSGVQYRQCQIGQDVSAARFVLYAKSILHPAGVRLPLTSPSTNMSPRRGQRIFHSFGGCGDSTRGCYFYFYFTCNSYRCSVTIAPQISCLSSSVRTNPASRYNFAAACSAPSVSKNTFEYPHS